eukprot:2810242-Pyramimonas_sp.AAC.4
MTKSGSSKLPRWSKRRMQRKNQVSNGRDAADAPAAPGRGVCSGRRMRICPAAAHSRGKNIHRRRSVVLLPLTGAEGDEINTLTFSTPLARCDVLARTASSVARITRHGTGPGRSLAVMPSSKLRPVPVGWDGPWESRGAPAGDLLHIKKLPAAAKFPAQPDLHVSYCVGFASSYQWVSGANYPNAYRTAIHTSCSGNGGWIQRKIGERAD